MENPVKRGKALALRKLIETIACDLEVFLGERACVQILCVSKLRRFAFALLSP